MFRVKFNYILLTLGKNERNNGFYQGQRQDELFGVGANLTRGPGKLALFSAKIMIEAKLDHVSFLFVCLFFVCFCFLFVCLFV